MISVFFRKRIVDSISFRAAMRMIPLLIPHILHLNQPLSAAIIYRSFSSLNFLYFLNSSHTRSSIFPPLSIYLCRLSAGAIKYRYGSKLCMLIHILQPYLLSDSKETHLFAPPKDACGHFHSQMCFPTWVFVDKEFSIK